MASRAAAALFAAISVLVVACTHDFDAYVPNGTVTDASTTDAKPDGTTTPEAAAPCVETGALTYVGHCYFAVTGNFDFDGAKALCITKGAHLATITSTAERDVIRQVGNARERWIGLSRPTSSSSADGSFQWITGEARAGFADWAVGEPSGSGTCARVRTGESAWADSACSDGHDALCERE
jgi:hypothetical protein